MDSALVRFDDVGFLHDGRTPILSGVTLTGVGDPDRLETTFVSRGFFGTLGVAPQAGRLPAVDEFVAGRDRVVVVSDSYWRARFGANPSVVGSVVRIEDQPFTLIGVMSPSFTFPSADVDVWIPISRITDVSVCSADWSSLATVTTPSPARCHKS